MSNPAESALPPPPQAPLVQLYANCKPLSEFGINEPEYRAPWFQPQLLIPQNSRYLWWLIAIGGVMILLTGSSPIIGILGLLVIVGHIAYVANRRKQVDEANRVPIRVTAASIMQSNLDAAKRKARGQAVEHAPPSQREAIMERLDSASHTVVLVSPSRSGRSEVVRFTTPSGEQSYLASSFDLTVTFLLDDGIFIYRAVYDAVADAFIRGFDTNLLAWRQIASVRQRATKLTFALSSGGEEVVYLGASKNQVKEEWSEEWSDEEFLIPDDEVITRLINPFVLNAQNLLIESQR